MTKSAITPQDRDGSSVMRRPGGRLLARAASTAASAAAPTRGPVRRSAAAPTAAAAAKTYKDLTVGFIQTGSEGGWRAANTASFKETREQAGHQPQVLRRPEQAGEPAHGVPPVHRRTTSVNVIILAALEATGWDDVLKEAKAAGKIVVLEDRRIDAARGPVRHVHRLRLHPRRAARPPSRCASCSKAAPRRTSSSSSATSARRRPSTAARASARRWATAASPSPRPRPANWGVHRGQGRHGGLPQEEQGHPGRVRPERRDGPRRRPGDQGSRPQARQGHQDHHRRRHQGRASRR